MWRRCWQAWVQWNDQRATRQRAIPDDLWLAVVQAHPFLLRRSADDLARLRRLVSLFLARKEFVGAQGLQVTDDMAVIIAAQACLPVLNIGLQAYAGFVGIVVHPDEVWAHRSEMDDDGIVHEFAEPLTGEAMVGGPVMLTWADVAAAGDCAEVGYNVVIHEFVHVLDMQDGVADGVPALSDSMAREHWRQVLNEELTDFRRRLDAGEPQGLDDYGAEGPEEFFAVASEAFFVAPELLVQGHPALYRLLAGYFLQDPLAHR